MKPDARSQHSRYRVYNIYRARQGDCASCWVRPRCLSKLDTPPKNLSIEVGSQRPSLIEQMKNKIDTLQGKRIYARRLAIVELVFAYIRVQKRLDHFTLRSKVKVDVQWRLFALVHNVGKIHQYEMIQ